MISIEAARDGFILSAEGRRLLSHSLRRPCLEIGRAEFPVRKGRASSRPRRVSWKALRGFAVLESGAEGAFVRFEGGTSVRFRLEEGLVSLSFSGIPSEALLFRMRFTAEPGERIYGLGERFTRLDLKGRAVTLRVEEPGAGRGGRLGAFLARLAGLPVGDPEGTPWPVPAFCSSSNAWCVVDGDARARFDFRRKATTTVETWGPPRGIALGVAEDAPRALAGLSRRLGRQSMPPSWSWDGAWLGLGGGREELRRKAQSALDAGVRVAALWVPDWCGSRSAGGPRRAGPRLLRADWRADPELYPDFRREVAHWRERGIRFLGSISPFLDLDSSLYPEARAAGFLLKDREGRECLLPRGGTPAALLDLSDPAARRWMKDLIRRELLGAGLDGWLADGGDRLPADFVPASGEEARDARNRWPLLWASLNREAIEEAGRSADTVFWMRSGWLGSGARSPIAWSGEQLADFSRAGGLPGLIPAAISAGISGLGFWHSEVGGGINPSGKRRDPELLLRWLELAAFSPFFRTGEGSHPAAELPAWTDRGYLGQLARMTEVFASLKPYHARAAEEYLREGLPPVRHPSLHYESERELHRRSGQYLYGRDLLVAPALAPGRALTELQLPDDEWIHLWSSRVFRGGSLTVDSPIGYPAVFYRAASPFAPLFDAVRRTARRTA